MRVFWLMLLAAAVPGADFSQWRATTITDSLKMGYQLVVADLNRDGRPDIIEVDERGTELAWFENPGWQRHVILNMKASTYIRRIPTRTVRAQIADPAQPIEGLRTTPPIKYHARTADVADSDDRLPWSVAVQELRIYALKFG